MPNRQLINASKFKVNSVCIGTVSGASEKGYYVDLGDLKTGISAFCKIVHGTDIPNTGDKVACQILSITDEGFAIVKITRIIRRINNNRF